jgi:hypothetical protein
MRLFALDGIVTAQHSASVRSASDQPPPTDVCCEGLNNLAPSSFDNKGAHKGCLVARGVQLVVSRTAGVEMAPNGLKKRGSRKRWCQSEAKELVNYFVEIFSGSQFARSLNYFLSVVTKEMRHWIFEQTGWPIAAAPNTFVPSYSETREQWSGK